MKWDNSNHIAVICAVNDDYNKIEMNGRDDATCPVCKKDSLKYQRTNIFNMTAWCSTCNQGIKQGEGAK